MFNKNINIFFFNFYQKLINFLNLSSCMSITSSVNFFLDIPVIYQVRQVVSDFAVIIAIFSMSTLDHIVGIPTPKLEVPTEFKPTLEGRGWIIWPFQTNPWWSAIGACLPALLGTILIFMDQQITAVIVNRKENKLKVSDYGASKVTPLYLSSSTNVT